MDRTIPFDVLESITIKSGNLNLLELFPNDQERYRFLKPCYIKRPADVIRYLLKNRRFDLFRVFNQEFEIAAVDDSYKLALECKSVEVMELWVECHLPYPYYVINDAAKTGCLEVVKWLYQRNPKLNQMILERAVESGNLELIKWVIETGNLNPNRCMVSHALNYLRYDVIQWFGDTYAFCPPIGEQHAVKWRYYLQRFHYYSECNHALIEAIEKGDMKVVEKFYSLFPIDINKSVATAVIKRNQLEFVKWFVKTCTHDSRTVRVLMKAIGYARNLDIVDYLVNRATMNNELFESMFDSAISNDNLPVFEHLIQLYRKMNPSDSFLRIDFGSVGHYEILKWRHRNNRLKLKGDEMDLAVQYGYLEVAQWLNQEFNLECSAEAVQHSLWFQHYETVLWACDRFNIPINPVLRELIESEYLEPELKFNSLSEINVDELVMNGKLITIRWLDEHHPESLKQPSDCALNIALQRGYHRTIEFVQSIWNLS